MALIIKSNLNTGTTDPKNGTDFTFEELQAAVGGFIEIIKLRKSDLILVVDEEGKCKNLPVNYFATKIARWAGAIMERDCICGDALLCKDREVK